MQLRTSTLEGNEYGPGAKKLGLGLQERLLGREVTGPAQGEATVLQGQVEVVVQEEGKREVRPVICTKGHVFRRAVNRKRRQARSWEEWEAGQDGWPRGEGPECAAGGCSRGVAARD